MTLLNSISIVIPVYNSAPCLVPLVAQLETSLRTLAPVYEIIFVEDDSPDDSWEILTSIQKENRNVSIYRLMRNAGQHAATLCGLSHARFEVVVTMDDDLQHRPDQLVHLVTELLNHPETDCVFGIFKKKFHKPYRNFGSDLIRSINNKAFGLPRDKGTSGFRVMKHSLAKAMAEQKSVNPSLPVILFNCTRKVRSVEVAHAPRYAGESNYTLVKQFRLAFDNICNATMLPLRLVSMAGVTLSGISVLLSLQVLFKYFTGIINAPGWTTVVLLICFFSGMIMLSLGIIGEYLVRVLREVNKKPLYIVREAHTGQQLPE